VMTNSRLLCVFCVIQAVAMEAEPPTNEPKIADNAVTIDESIERTSRPSFLNGPSGIPVNSIRRKVR
jgi:hypothetical protein